MAAEGSSVVKFPFILKPGDSEVPRLLTNTHFWVFCTKKNHLKNITESLENETKRRLFLSQLTLKYQL